MTERKNHRMDAEGKRLLETEIDCIVQRMPQWGKYIPKNDEIRKQITAIFHAVSGYVANGIVSEDCLQKISAAVAQYDIFSGKSLGWAINVQGDFSLKDYCEERGRLRSVEKNVCLLIAEIDISKERQKTDTYREDLHKAMSERDALKKGMSGRQKISQKLAAEICGVDIRTIRNWEKGLNTPEWYAGRNMDTVEFETRYKMGTKEKKMQAARKKNLENTISLDRLKKF